MKLLTVFAALLVICSAYAGTVNGNDPDKNSNPLVTLLEAQTAGFAPAFTLGTADFQLRQVAGRVYLFKKPIFDTAAKLISGTPLPSAQHTAQDERSARARLFVLNVIQPVIQGDTSRYFTEEVVPNFTTFLSKTNAEYAVVNLSSFKGDRDLEIMGLQLLHEGLVALQPFFSGDDATALQQMNARVGAALASGADPRQMAVLEEALSSHEDLIERASVANRTESVGLMVGSLAGFF